MAKRKQSGFEVVASMPWPVGLVLGLIAYIAIRHGIGWYFGATNNQFTSGLGKLAATGIYAPIGWIALAGCWIAALASFISRRSRRQLLDKQTGIDSLRQMNWRQFEQLTGEAFRRQGYAIEETGLGGADGGIDLILRRNGQITLVQCKQWQNRQVGVTVVREMYGLLMHHKAATVKIVALGDYTTDARRFAQGKPIELIHGGELISTVRSLQTSKAQAAGPMDSPLALGGSMLASLLVIGVLASGTSVAPPNAIPSPAATRPAAVRLQAPMSRPAPATPSAHPQATIYMSDSQDAAQLREWKKQNAESMKILEKTTKEVPLR
ncbi:restriction endonuclease [Rhodanobacter sp. C01]|uniref:restriction endonuclease n=1 Tax=Rhodanobacter sp. C01 TaxID=1945856 RepID=UPI0009873471|nr:restriction endonuclease [Rhodanobacter sp. C01]OOG51540.1 restriction endonuclease [Rhodanobacter sp. C01]